MLIRWPDDRFAQCGYKLCKDPYLKSARLQPHCRDCLKPPRLYPYRRIADHGLQSGISNPVIIGAHNPFVLWRSARIQCILSNRQLHARETRIRKKSRADQANRFCRQHVHVCSIVFRVRKQLKKSSPRSFNQGVRGRTRRMTHCRKNRGGASLRASRLI